MAITFITLKMVFVLARTISDASNLASKSENQFYLVYSSMSSGLLTQRKCNIVIRCGTTENVAMELPPRFLVSYLSHV